MDLVVDKSGAADAISERIEHKDGVKSGKANRMFQLLLIGWVPLICKNRVKLILPFTTK